jgi:sorting nexin-9/18/33
MSSSVKIINPGFLYRNYEVYGISSPLVKSLVYRKQSDFIFLRENLIRLHPGYAIPILPKHHLKRLEANYLNARKEELQLFLNKVIEHPLVKTSIIVWDFLVIENEKEYEAAKANALKIPTPNNISECINIKGNVNINFNDSLLLNCNNIEEGVKKMLEELNK